MDSFKKMAHFSQANPKGTGQGDISALLRRVADALETLGDVWVQDITFHSAPTGDEDELHMTVYYVEEPRPR